MLELLSELMLSELPGLDVLLLERLLRLEAFALLELAGGPLAELLSTLLELLFEFSELPELLHELLPLLELFELLNDEPLSPLELPDD